MEKSDVINERLCLVQDTSGLRFGTDAFLLSCYVHGGKRKIACDLGCGTGVISLLLAARGTFAHVTAVELQEKYADMARGNAEANGLRDKIDVVCADVRDRLGAEFEGKYDAVVTNPPYYPADSGLHSAAEENDLARREICGGIDAFLACADRCLKHGGLFFCVYPPDRIADLICAMRQNHIEPKRITTVFPSAGKRPCLLLAEGKKGGAAGCYFTPPLILTDANGAESAEYRYIYEKGSFPDAFRRP